MALSLARTSLVRAFSAKTAFAAETCEATLMSRGKVVDGTARVGRAVCDRGACGRMMGRGAVRRWAVRGAVMGGFGARGSAVHRVLRGLGVHRETH